MTFKEKFNKSMDNFIKFPASIIFSPFKRFDDFKDGSRGSFLGAIVWVFIYGLLRVMRYQYTGFLLNYNDPREFNAPIILITSIIPIFLISIANWSITTLMDGKGKMKEILGMVSYALFPYIICGFISIIVSNFVVKSDLVLYKAINIIGLAITIFLVFVGLVVIQEFGFFKTLLAIFLTIVAFIVILFLILLFFNLLQRTLGFTGSVIEELIYRLKV